MEQVANANSAGGQPVKRGLDPAIANLVAGMQVAQKIVWRKSLSGISRYQFCPFCIRKEGLKKKDIDRFLSLRDSRKKLSDEEREFMDSVFSRLSVMEARRKKILLKVSEDFGVVTFDTDLKCPSCGSDITIPDLEDFWCSQPRSDAGEKKYIRLDNPDWQEEFYGNRRDDG